MESNKDEALRCFLIAEKHFNAENLVAARKFCTKSISLFSTPQAEKLLVKINNANSSSPPNGSSNTSGAEEHPSATGMKHRHQNPPWAAPSPTSPNGSAKKRDYTQEQHTIVKRVRSCKVTEYYEILELKKECEEADVKRAYRKLALALHPDKNGAPGADEAFKMVSKAFQILSDPQKRAAYDRSGGDPEDRSGAGGGMSSFFNQGDGRAGGAGFDGEINPEELFNMFFGNGGLGGGFGGPGTAFSFGGPGVFTASFGPGGFQAGRGTAAAGQATPRSLVMQLLPLIILFGFSLLSTLPNLFSTPPVPDPRFAFQSSTRYSTQRETGGLGVRYFVNQAEFQKHPVIGTELAREGAKASSSLKTRGPALQKFEESVDKVYIQDKYTQCQRGVDRKNRLKENEIGLFGIGTDWEKVKKIEDEPIESCEELKRLHVL